MPDLVLVHLSDIHFKASDGRIQDLNKDLRNELLMDLRRQRTHLRKFDAIVVTGDLAYSGKASEFDIASQWLDVLREQLDVPEKNILVTAGNHDVDRAKVTASEDITKLHAKMRACAANSLQSVFADSMSKEEGNHFFEAIADFNAFARQYGCEVDRDKPFWERDFPLRDGVVLRIRGMTSTCISGWNDDDGANKMILGQVQYALRQEPGVEYLTLAHHPPSWLLDQDNAQRYLNTRARIQLYGHKHEHWIEPVAQGIRLVAGAVHPERSESNWIPRYDVLVLHVERRDDRRFLEVIVYPRRWSIDETCFIADCDASLLPIREYSFSIAGLSISGESPRSAAAPAADGKRRLKYRLAMLAKDLQIRLAQKLDLIGGADLHPDASDFVDALIRLAEEKESLSALFDLVEKYHGEMNQHENPFDRLLEEEGRDE
jgi:predicted MPP superfamily phosphohydrolase